MPSRDTCQSAVLLIGDVGSPSFEPVRHQTPTANGRCVANLQAAQELLDSEGWSPDLVVVWQAVPDEYPQSRVAQFIGQLPLARWVVVFGPWCESIGRTEQLWPVAWTVPLRHAATRIHTELLNAERGTPPAPATMSRDESFAAHHRQPEGRPQMSTASISGDDREYCLFLNEALRLLGLEVIDTQQAELQIVHVTVPGAGTTESIRERRRQSPDARLVVVSELITPQVEQQLIDAGADATFTQLRFVNELEAWL